MSFRKVMHMRFIKWLLFGFLIRRFGWLGIALTAAGLAQRYLGDRKESRSA